MPCSTCLHDPRCQDVCQHSSCATGQALPRELMESCLAAAQEATFAGFADSVLKDKITRLHETVYRMGFQSGWRIREKLAVESAPDVGKAQAPSSVVPNEATREMQREIALRFAFVPVEEDYDMAAEAWRAALRVAAIAQSAPSPVLLEAGKEGQR